MQEGRAWKSTAIMLLPYVGWFIVFHAAMAMVGGRNNTRVLLAHLGFSLGIFLLNEILRSGGPLPKATGRLLRFLVSLLAGVLAAGVVYRVETGGPLTNATFGAILQTDPSEAADFILGDLFSWLHITSFILGACFTLAVLSRPFPLPKLSQWARLGLGGAAVLLLVLTPGRFYPVYKFFEAKSQYEKELAVLSSMAAGLDRASAIQAVKAHGGELYVIVMGESASRDYMQAYGGPVPNTPWMKRMEQEEGFVRFEHPYSSNVSTVPSICSALEMGNWYTGIRFPHVPTLLSVSRAAGMKTAWLSNQTRFSAWGTPISSIADSADVSVFLNTGTGAMTKVRSDMLLFPEIDAYLAEHGRSDESAVVVVHIAGSHFPYARRYSDSTARMLPIEDAALAEARSRNYPLQEVKEYYTSLLETDLFLEKLHERLKAVQDRPVALIYFSDHGNDPRPGYHHNADRFTWPMARIPFTVWLSKAYRERYPERLPALKANAGKVITNDLLFNLYTGLADIRFEGRDDRYDISSRDYILTEEDAVTVFGKRRIKDDPGMKEGTSLREE